MNTKVEAIREELEYMIELGTDKSVLGNYEAVLANTELALNVLESFDFEDTSYEIEKTTGGNTGQGCSILITAYGSEVFGKVIAKVSDHDNYSHNLMIMDYASENDIKEILNYEDVKEELELYD